MPDEELDWSPQQRAAIEAVRDWFAEQRALRDNGKILSKPVFRLFGYAGTGKTTLAKYLAREVRCALFAAFTGKASFVLEQKGCSPSSTIHSLIYQISDETDLGEPIFSLNPGSDLHGAGLLVLDECSMVNDEMGEDLLGFGVPILVLGDPGQLPPIHGTGFFTEARPDILLTEIHRQAEGDPIIDLATRARHGEPLPTGWHNDTSYVGEFGLRPDANFLASVDQVLVGRNATRHAVNRTVRKHLGFEQQGRLPVVGDKLICLRNFRDLGLVNGSMWKVGAVLEVLPRAVRLSLESLDLPGWTLDDVSMYREIFEDPAKFGARPWHERAGAQEFDYGYAITVHKAQGSQWGRVLLVNESYCFRDEAHRWLYTGLTRAAESVMVAAF